MAAFMEYLANGAFFGALYALLALPMFLIWSTTDVVDINIGGYVIVAGVVSASVGGVTGWLLGVMAALGMGAVTGLLFLAFHWLWDMKDMMRIVLATFGLLLITASAVQALVGTDNLYLSGLSGSVHLLGFRLSTQGMFNLLLASAFLLILFIVLNGSASGLRMRAAAASAASAALVGIAVRRMQFMAFLVGSGMAGIVGILAAMTTGVSYSRGLQFSVYAVTAVILLGLRGPATVFLGGILLGIFEQMGVAYLPSGWSQLLPPALILLVLASGRSHTISVHAVRA
ncbi:branched-chain amino acid ABC transporter permease [Nocardioides sp.]|uniref:branched-chain amino acid ABC transporter permease n=1 Tax=Nocardioides sp. TaxID=35761 RepID=UPI00260462B1|nr:branched-chain amino acid ABC transporter permease [Nocardioides sp.]MDI6912316.1 branched-chain amino acid ABC transporter permease [Nocardioides sp.]